MPRRDSGEEPAVGNRGRGPLLGEKGARSHAAKVDAVTISDFLTRIVAILEDAGVPYMITGSLAAAFHASPRATQDVDIIVDPSLEELDAVVAGLLAEGFYVSEDAARSAYRTRGQFNAIDSDRGWKVDLILRKERPFSVTEFARRRKASLLGIDVSIATVEDLILAKLEWMSLSGSELQRRDVEHLLEEAGDSLDLAYVESWVEELGLRGAWDELRGG